MTFLPNTLLAVSSIAAVAQALPNVTPVLAEGGCSVYPGYDADTGIAGPWVVMVDQCVNSTTPGVPCTIEGFGSSAEPRILAGDTGIHEGYITIVHRNDLAKNPLRCNSAQPAGSTLQANVPSGVSGYSWTPLQVADIPYSAPLMWGLEEEYSHAVEPYYHVDADGVRQEGLFLGAHNVTSWGIEYVSSGFFGLPYWFIRLLGPDSEDPVTGEPLGDNESVTFIRVDGS
ncbi:hypothetical protein FQN54_005085 [Arachnomyces sp. PD_36]|nr:hypothetical protein FQN54_005085 [Arachnomyces sp. PD_36]